MTDKQDPPPARELPRLPGWTSFRAYLVHQDTAHELNFHQRDNARLMTTADLSACLAALPEAERAELLVEGLRSLPQRRALVVALDAGLEVSDMARTDVALSRERAEQAVAKLGRSMAVVRYVLDRISWSEGLRVALVANGFITADGKRTEET